MSSLNHCIKFELDVKDENIVFKDYFYKSIKLQKHKIYEAEFIQLACAFYGSVELLHNGHLITNIHYPTANASLPVIIRLAKQRVDPKYKKKVEKQYYVSTYLYILECLQKSHILFSL